MFVLALANFILLFLCRPFPEMGLKCSHDDKNIDSSSYRTQKFVMLKNNTQLSYGFKIKSLYINPCTSEMISNLSM
jgi:hypothetical protein